MVKALFQWNLMGVQYLFGELRSHMPWGVAKTFFLKEEKNPVYINYLNPNPKSNLERW